MKLTKSVVERATYRGAADSKARDARWDTEIKGFGMRIFPSGHKSFILKYRLNGKAHLIKLGNFPTLTVDQARALARKKLAQVCEGVDPLAVKAESRPVVTVDDLCKEYETRHAVKKRSSRDDLSRTRRHVRPAWGKRAASSITFQDVALLHDRIGQSAPYEANRTVALVRKMFNLARRWGLIEPNAVNPAQGIERFPEAKRERFVTPKELPALAREIDAVQDVYSRAALWLYLLLATRKQELLRIRHEDLDLDGATLRLPDTKNGKTHHLPLSQAAVAIIRQLPELHGNPYLFPGRKHQQHLVNIDKVWRRVRAGAGLDDVRLHDLRRTVGSWLAQAGKSLHLIGTVLNHRSQETTRVYAHFLRDNVRQALEDHAQQVVSIAKQAGVKPR